MSLSEEKKLAGLKKVNTNKHLVWIQLTDFDLSLQKCYFFTKI